MCVILKTADAGGGGRREGVLSCWVGAAAVGGDAAAADGMFILLEISLGGQPACHESVCGF